MKKSKLGPYEIYFDNEEEFHGLKREIWGRHDYWAELTNPEPVILDVGAHIGVATLYFAYSFPKARIVALEPNPEVLPILEQNILMNKLEKRVLIQPVALSAEKHDKAAFYMDASVVRWYSTGGLIQGAWNGKQQSREIAVSSMPLSALLNEPVDLLKMDIEGVEQAVLHEAKAELKNVRHLFVEFHPRPNQLLAELVEFLEELGFKVSVFKEGKEVRLNQAVGLVLIEGVR